MTKPRWLTGILQSRGANNEIEDTNDQSGTLIFFGDLPVVRIKNLGHYSDEYHVAKRYMLDTDANQIRVFEGEKLGTKITGYDVLPRDTARLFLNSVHAEAGVKHRARFAKMQVRPGDEVDVQLVQARSLNASPTLKLITLKEGYSIPCEVHELAHYVDVVGFESEESVADPKVHYWYEVTQDFTSLDGKFCCKGLLFYMLRVSKHKDILFFEDELSRKYEVGVHDFFSGKMTACQPPASVGSIMDELGEL